MSELFFRELKRGDRGEDTGVGEKGRRRRERRSEPGCDGKRGPKTGHLEADEGPKTDRSRIGGERC